MYNNKIKKNSSGFAHQALLGVLVVAVISFVGVRLLTLSHAQNIQTASTASMSTSCDHIKLIAFSGIQESQADPNIPTAIDTRLILKDPHSIDAYRAVFNIRNTKANWHHTEEKEHYASQNTWGVSIYFGFRVPIWVATAGGGFTWTLHVYGIKGHHQVCHSEIKGYATTACDAKTGLWRLNGYRQ